MIFLTSAVHSSMGQIWKMSIKGSQGSIMWSMRLEMTLQLFINVKTAISTSKLGLAILKICPFYIPKKKKKSPKHGKPSALLQFFFPSWIQTFSENLQKTKMVLKSNYLGFVLESVSSICVSNQYNRDTWAQ